MNKSSATTSSAAATSSAGLSVPGPDAEATTVTQADPAGEMALSGRNRACARARVLAGMVLTSGIVVALSAMDNTSVSAPNIVS
ncbi:hypothetical protein [Streptomyces sp. NPDC088725]|uniref:hypothetical protein n=1 Tax=Streptomyces sp. NPDC088725 TaxID=3365873 RepID=UPI0038302541